MLHQFVDSVGELKESSKYRLRLNFNILPKHQQTVCLILSRLPPNEDHSMYASWPTHKLDTQKSPEVTRPAARRLLLGVISFDVMIALALFLNAFWVTASICSV